MLASAADLAVKNTTTYGYNQKFLLKTLRSGQFRLARWLTRSVKIQRNSEKDILLEDSYCTWGFSHAVVT